MAITLSGLVPAKESTGILLSSSLAFNLTSDADDLDSSTIVFTVNGVETNITVVETTTVSFDFSRTLADLDYGQRYVCTISISDTAGLSFFDSFPFSIEEGIFINSNFRKYNYFHTTQELANLLPETQKARYDRFSNFQQYYNKFGGAAEEIDRALIRQLASYFVQTADLNDLSILHKVDLPGNFQFQESLLDDGTLLFKPPEITGLKGLTKFDVDPDFNNDLFSFFFGRIPDRITLENTVTFSEPALLDTTAILAEPILIEKELAIPGGYVLTLDGVGSFIRARNPNELIGLTALVSGVSLFGQPINETITFTSNGQVFSKKQWNRIDSIEFYDFPDFNDITGTVKIDYHPEVRSLVKDVYKYSNIDRTEFVRWKIEDGPFGTLLQTFIPKGADAFSQIANPLDDLLREYELLDVDNTTPVSLIDFTADLFADKVYGVDSEHLYLYNKLEEYPTGIGVLSRATKDTRTVIELQASELARELTGKEISIKGKQITFDQRVASYRFRILKPDGSYVTVLPDGSTTTSTAFVPVNSSRTNFETPSISFTLTDLGDHYVFLETRYGNGRIDCDIKLVRNLKKSAISKYKLEKFIGAATPVKLFTDFDQKVKLLDSDDNLHEIAFHRDNVLINFDDKILFFNEAYDSVDVD